MDTLQDVATRSNEYDSKVNYYDFEYEFHLTYPFPFLRCLHSMLRMRPKSSVVNSIFGNHFWRYRLGVMLVNDVVLEA